MLRAEWINKIWYIHQFSSVQSLSCFRFFAAPGTVACQAPLSIRFPRQEYRNGLPWPPPGDLPDPGIEPTSLLFPALAGGFFTTSATWEAPSRSRPSLKDDQKRERLGQFPSEAGNRAQWSVGPYPQMGCKIHLCVAISIFSGFSPAGLTLRTKHAGMSPQTESQAKLSAHNRKQRGNSCPWKGKG